jgi:CHAT domain
MGIVRGDGAPRFRTAPGTSRMSSANLSHLPRLPDTAEEVRAIAVALNANPARDVYLGAGVNERTIRTADLQNRRVIVFATHGLVPGDLDGLSQPALALSSPEVAGNPPLNPADPVGKQELRDSVRGPRSSGEPVVHSTPERQQCPRCDDEPEDPGQTMAGVPARQAAVRARVARFVVAQITRGSDRCRGEPALGRRGPGCCRRIRPA